MQPSAATIDELMKHVDLAGSSDKKLRSDEHTTRAMVLKVLKEKSLPGRFGKVFEMDLDRMSDPVEGDAYTLDELREVLRDAFVISQDGAKELLKQTDSNMDGQVSFGEFKGICKVLMRQYSMSFNTAII